MDWNWFFSALAQSTAAIVGIFAAFIITKIINNQGALDQKRRDAKRQLADCLALERRAKEHFFKWYNDRIREIEFGKLKHVLSIDSQTPIDMPASKGKFERTLEKLKFSLYDDLFYIESTIDKLRDALKGDDLTAVKKVFNESIYVPARASRSQNGLTASTPIDHYIGEVFRRELGSKKGELDSLRREIGTHIRRAEDFIDDNSDNPESSSLVTWSILAVILLFYVGVICPLIILPLGTSESFQLSVFTHLELSHYKEVLLISISVIFTIIMLVFMNINRGLKLSQEDLNELKRFSDYSEYSEYLANYEKNTA